MQRISLRVFLINGAVYKMRTLEEENKARDEFEQLLSDDSDFKSLWGLENDDDYDELDFQEWYQEHYQNLKLYKGYSDKNR